MIKDPTKRSASQKIYRDKHKEDAKEYAKKYKFLHKEEISRKHKEYYLANKEKWVKRGNRYYWDNKEKRFEYIRGYCVRNRNNWLEYLLSKNPSPKCEVCGKELKYFDGKDGIHFDHRENGNESIQHHPSSWMGRHPLNKNNIEKFESCNFGILCIRCNRILPTIGRQSFMRRLIKYVFKKDIIL
jgi:hypothetical protein